MKDGNILGVEKGVLENPVPPVVALEVNNVSADNLKEIKVVFNQKVDKESLIPNNFSLSDNLKIKKIDLLEDEVTAVITIEKPMVNQKTYKISAKDVKALDENASALVEIKDREFDCLDQTMPVVEEIKFAGPKHLTLVFNEPIDKEGSLEVKLGKNTLYVNTSKTVKNDRMVSLELYTSFQEDKEYEVTIKEFKDFSGYSNLIKTQTIKYNKDTELPTITKIDATQEKVTLEFSKPVKNIKAENFYHTFSSYIPKSVSVKPSEYTDKVTLVFWDGATTDKALPEGSVKFAVNGTGIVDLWGNKLESKDFTLSVTGDNEKPEITSVKVKDSGLLEVTFSKSVDLKKENITIKKNAVALAIPNVGSVAGKEKKVWNVEFKGASQNDTLELTISGAKDTTVNANTMVAHSETLTVADTKAPVLKKITYKYPKHAKGEAAVITFWFDEVLDSSALNISNFVFQHKKGASNYENLEFLGAAEFVVGEQAVRVTIKDWDLLQKMFSAANTFTANSFIAVTGIKDIVGQEMSGVSIAVGDGAMVGLESANKANAKKATITAKNKLSIEFDRMISKIVPSDLTIKATNAGGNLTADQYSISSIEGTIVNIELNDGLDANDYFNPDHAEAQVDIAAGNKIETIEGLEVAAGNIATLKDTIRPVFKLNATNDGWDASAVKDGATDTKITIKFSETISLADHEAVVGKAFVIEKKAAVDDDWSVVSAYTTGYTLTPNAATLEIVVKGYDVTSASANKIKVTFKGTDLIIDSDENAVVTPSILEYEFTQP